MTAVQGLEPGSYGDAIADVYDDWHATAPRDGDPETDSTVEYLASLAGTGSVLELGVGTGRVALPLAARGVPVSGIRFVHGRSIGPSHVTVDEVRLDVAIHDPVDQTVTGHQVHITTGGFRLVPIHLRYIWPSEVDLMARLAGLDLARRYSDWDGEPSGVRSRRHISTYTRSPLTHSPEQDRGQR